MSVSFTKSLQAAKPTTPPSQEAVKAEAPWQSSGPEPMSPLALALQKAGITPEKF